jgi:murein DD-endopeptidase MepM/ murein hydrolase activator NlpD
MSVARLLALASLAALLAGCMRDEPPAPVTDAENPGMQSAGPGRVAPPPLETAGGKLTVRPGQTLYAVARDAKVPVRALIDANQLQPPYKLQAGQILTVPHTRQHIVQPGETLYAVARQYGVEASSLARENHLNPPYSIKSGAVLILPTPVETASAAPLPPPAAAPAAAAGPSPGPGSVSVVPLPPPMKPATPPPAAAPEAAHAPTPLQPSAPPPGVTATAPPVAAAAPPTAPATAPPVATVAAASPPPPQPIPAPVKPAPQPAAAPTAPPPAEPDSTAKPAAAASAAAVAAAVAGHAEPVAPLFGWPVRGRILSVFGTAAAGTHSDGINIAAPTGTTVSAAESGIVAYAGNELRGFGNLLLIKHADGWVTAYAHNEVLLVKKGQKIRRGEPIARVGSSGGVGQPQLHFELRRGTKAIDPLDHLPPQSADAG